MDNFPIELKPNVLSLVLTGVLGLMTWIGKRHIRKVDDHDQRIGQLEQNTLTREEFQKYTERNAVERREMHQENLENIREVRDAVSTVNTNIISALSKGVLGK